MIAGCLGIYNTHVEAENGIKELQKAGFDLKKLSIVGQGYHTEEHAAGPLVSTNLAGLEGAVMVRGVSALGTTLVSIGVPTSTMKRTLMQRNIY